jgi:hypothetical protein
VHKNVGPFIAFNKDWFAKNQRVLLWLLNAPLIKVWFRWVLGIHNDCPRDVRITDIAPSNFSYGDRLVEKNGERLLERTTDFRTHPKFGKRLYYAFRPLWWAIHFWDWSVADRFVPQWSYGFFTLTAFPAAGSSSPVDGTVGRGGAIPVNQTFANIRSGAGDYHSNTDDGLAQLSATTTTDQYGTLIRNITCFDTSALTSGATISSAVLSLWGNFFSKNDLGNSNLHIAGATPASTSGLADADYGQCQNTSLFTPQLP